MTDLLLQEQRFSPAEKDCLSIIEASGKHLLTVINDVLDSAKIESGKLNLVKEVLNLNDCIQEAVGICSFQAQLKGLTIQQLLPSESCWLEGDPLRIVQVIVNLLGNAIKFSARSPIVLQLEVFPKGKDILAQLSVEDYGIGIPPLKLQNIFKEFSQVDTSTTKTFGTGLGLSISRRLVEMWGGEISATSTEGKGSKFSFTIPSRRFDNSNATASAKVPPSVKSQRNLRELRVLVAEDNVTNQKVISKMLQHVGCHQFDIVQDGEKAIEKVKEEQSYDLVLMDLFMPNCDGWSAARVIRELPIRQPRIVALSASMKSEVETDTLFDSFLSKPIGLAQLRETVQQSLQL